MPITILEDEAIGSRTGFMVSSSAESGAIPAEVNEEEFKKDKCNSESKRRTASDADEDGLVENYISNSSVHVRECKGSVDFRKSSSSASHLALPAQQILACQHAQKQYLDDFRDSQIQDKASSFPSFTKEEVKKGKLLGRGTFGQVLECQGISIPEFENQSTKRRQSLWKRRLDDSQKQSVMPPEVHLALEDVEISQELADIPPPLMMNTSLSREVSRQVHDHVQTLACTEQRKFLAQHCWRDSGAARYALKTLKASLIANPNQLFQAILDLNLETRFLSSLEYHPNIIRLRAISQGDRFDPHYFILLDRLYDTLETRLEKWKHDLLYRDHPASFRISVLWKCCRSATTTANVDAYSLKELHQATANRLWFAFDLASAMAHLHNHGVMHRDLKPDNIGFDIRGDIKIFDLGLAKEIPRGTPGPWRLTSTVGSPRYMAPEVATGKSYNERCDVYSLALVIWEMMNLQKPFGKTTLKKLEKTVWNSERCKRPNILTVAPAKANGTDTDDDMEAKSQAISDFLTIPEKGWTHSLKTTVEKSWDHDIFTRSTMEELESALNKELTACLDCIERVHGEISSNFLGSKRLSHENRRSTFVFVPAETQLPAEDNRRKPLIMNWIKKSRRSIRMMTNNNMRDSGLTDHSSELLGRSQGRGAE